MICLEWSKRPDFSQKRYSLCGQGSSIPDTWKDCRSHERLDACKSASLSAVGRELKRKVSLSGESSKSSICPEGHFVGRVSNGNNLCPVGENQHRLLLRQGSELYGSFYWDWAQCVGEPVSNYSDIVVSFLASHLLSLTTLWLLEWTQHTKAELCCASVFSAIPPFRTDQDHLFFLI